MPSKFCGGGVTAVGTYIQLDATVSGMATVTFNNPTTQAFNIVTNAADATAAAAEETAWRYISYPAGAQGLTIDCIPNQTWFEWQGTSQQVGTNRYSYHISW